MYSLDATTRNQLLTMNQSSQWNYSSLIWMGFGSFPQAASFTTRGIAGENIFSCESKFKESSHPCSLSMKEHAEKHVRKAKLFAVAK